MPLPGSPACSAVPGEAIAIAQAFLRWRVRRRAPDSFFAHVFDDFFHFYQPVILAFLRRFHLGFHDREDVGQEVWLAIVDGFADLHFNDGGAGLRSWLYRVVSAKAIDLIRRRAHSLGVAWEALVLDRPELASWKDEPAAALDELWQEHMKQVLVEQLRRETPADTFHAFSMRYLDRRSVAETADALSLTVDQVKYRCRCALGKLKALRQLYQGDPFDTLAAQDSDPDS